MTPIDPLSYGKCKAHNQRGEPCGARALIGQRVCHYHGGKSPQALRKAEDRMKELVHPAISSLQKQIEAGEFPATRYVLDWAGFKAAEKVEGSGEVTIRIVHEDQPITLDAGPYAQLNGRTDG